MPLDVKQGDGRTSKRGTSVVRDHWVSFLYRCAGTGKNEDRRAANLLEGISRAGVPHE